MTDTVAQEPVFHPSFTAGDIVIVANDKAHFAAKCERLARGKYITDPLRPVRRNADKHGRWTGEDISHSELMRRGNTFEIDADSTLTGYFLAFLGADIPLLPPTSFADTAKLLHLCDRFECTEEHVGLVRERLEGESVGKLWRLLALASKLDDRKLGVMALKRMTLESFSRGREPEDKYDGVFVIRMSELSWARQGRLYNLALKAERATADRLA
uniref:BTB domain-containing protein n=1 Tax=Kwoniella bestiolae CBS 10118 TaxID=1296100 RepID=A0A1B9G9T2_9TREE|nr:hypothetical protein I302_02637 [Kwoniella bestiolae CBS 10118]OCF27788.1 hypothetical protein I302_02637 [Kwoniella bestiolae CBS 10118]